MTKIKIKNLFNVNTSKLILLQQVSNLMKIYKFYPETSKNKSFLAYKLTNAKV